jgi:hypothetical protein
MDRQRRFGLDSDNVLDHNSGQPTAAFSAENRRLAGSLADQGVRKSCSPGLIVGLTGPL